MERLQLLAQQKTVSSAEKLWKKAKENNLGLTKKQVTDYWKSRSTTQVIRGTPVSTESKPIRCWTGTLGCCQIDLMDISRYSHHNRQFKFLLNCVDVHSRYAWSFPVKNKQPSSIVGHLSKVIKDYKETCNKCLITIYSDDGNEWKGAVDKLLKKHQIKRVATTHKQNMAIVERFHQTLWKTLNISYFAENDFSFVDDIPELLKEYNNFTHSTLKTTPSKVFHSHLLPAHAMIPEFDLTKPAESKEPLKKGDLVRKIESRKTFDKPSTSLKFSQAVYKVIDKEFNRYVLENVDNGNRLETKYLARELQKTKDTTAIPKQQRRQALQKQAIVTRRNKKEPSNKLDEGERRRLQPAQSRRSASKPIRFRGDGIIFF